jgi:putative FmdB family regulatory protein
MAVYSYQCKSCSHTEDVHKPIAEYQRQEPCPKCQQPMERLIAPIGAVIFKGPGFYVNDYKKKK